MKKVLISNPFLLPPSGDNEEERNLFRTRADFVKNFILFSLKDFQKAWNEEAESFGRQYQEDLFTPPVQSPTLTSTEPFDFAMDANDELMTDIPNFDFEEFQFSPVCNDLDKESFFQKEQHFADETKQKKDQDFFSIDSVEPTMFPTMKIDGSFVGKIVSTTDDHMPAIEPIMGSESNPLIEGESMWLDLPDSDKDFDLLKLTDNDPDPPMQQQVHINIATVDPSPIAFNLHEPAAAVKVEIVESIPCAQNSSSRITRTRRKSVQTSRNVQDSPMSFQLHGEESIDLQALECKLNTETKHIALATLNGTENRSRHVSTATTEDDCSFSKPTRVNKNGEERKKRKYEIEDDNDPSVKNAKAAKLNRDKKKVQMQDLKRKVDDLNSENHKLKQDIEQMNNNHVQTEHQLRQEIKNLNHLLLTEKGKNSANSKQKVTMLDLIKNVTSVMQPTPTVICVTERLAATQMPDPIEIDSIRSMQPQPQHSNGTDTYLTFKDPRSD